MNLCSSAHEEICYDSRDCPACGLLDDLKAANEKLDELKDEITMLNDENNDLGRTIGERETQIEKLEEQPAALRKGD